MKLPIPSDWSGDWLCVKIDWPDSVEYVALLAGLLSMLGRGRLYDETTGVISDAQQVGRDIWARNWPLRGCDASVLDGDKGSVPDIPDSTLTGAIMALGEVFMATVTGQVIGVEWRGCELWVKTYPCCEWHLVGAPCDMAAQDTDPAWPEDSTYSACGKAYAMVGAIYTIAEGVWDNKDGITYWASAVDGSIDSLLPGVDVSNQGLLALLNGARALDDTYTDTDMFDGDTRQRYLCMIAALLDADSYGITDLQYDQLKSTVQQVYPTDQVGWWQGVITSIGKSGLSRLAAAAATDTSQDCDCPSAAVEVPTEPNSAGWYLSAPYDAYVVTYVNSSAPERHLLINLTPDHDVFGAVWTQELNDYINYKVMSAYGLDPALKDWGMDTSLNEHEYKTRVCWGPASLWDSVFGSGAYYHLGTGNLSSTTPASPSAVGVAGSRQGLAAESVYNHGGTITVSQLRLLHNVNSPSHS